jgi:hypothetical protein
MICLVKTEGEPHQAIGPRLATLTKLRPLVITVVTTKF